jgi:hypothetical protein
MRRLWSQRWFRITACVFLVVSVVLGLFCRYFGIRSHNDVIAYYGMSQECPPVWKDLALRRVSAGQSVEEAIQATSPLLVERHGSYVTLTYQHGLSFSGIMIVARNGRLRAAEAMGCTWQHKFFDEWSEADWNDWRRSYDAYIKSGSGAASKQAE